MLLVVEIREHAVLLCYHKKTLSTTILKNFKPHLCHLMVLFPTTVVTAEHENHSLSLQGVPESCMPLHQCPPTEICSIIFLTGMVVRFSENILTLTRLCTFKAPLYPYQLLCKFAAGQMVNRTSGVCIYVEVYTYGLSKGWFGQGVSPVQPGVDTSFHHPSCFLTTPSFLFFSSSCYCFSAIHQSN